MVRTYWLAILVIACLSQTAQAEEAPRNYGERSQTNTTQSALSAQPEPPLRVTTNTKNTYVASQNTIGKISLEENRKEEERQAQLSMANSARQMFYVGLAETTITLIGVFLVLATLLYTRQAARAARDAVIEAEKSTKANREIGEAQVRAYPAFIPKRVEISTDGNVDASGKPLFVDRIGIVMLGEIKNTGQSPAQDVAAHFIITQMPASDRLAPLRELRLKETPPVAGDIGGGDFREQTFQDTLTLNIALLMAGQIKIRIAGKLVYKDVFGTRLEATFDGFIKNIGPYVAQYMRTKSIDGAPVLQWEWTKSEDYQG